MHVIMVCKLLSLRKCIILLINLTINFINLQFNSFQFIIFLYYRGAVDLDLSLSQTLKP